jgi:general secretion pathway protein D
MIQRHSLIRMLTGTAALLGCCTAQSALGAQEAETTKVVARGDSVTIQLVDADLRSAVQALSRYMDRPVVFSGMAGVRVTLETQQPVPRSAVPRMLRGLLDSQGMMLVDDSVGGIYRLVQKAQAMPAQPQAYPSNEQSGDGGQQTLYVIHLRHAKAAEVAATVNALYGRASALGEIGDLNSPSLARDLEQNRAPPVSTGAPIPPNAVASVAGQAAALAGEVTIVPDARANSLLVRASARDFALVEAAVREIDVRPLQVLIEVLIAEVRRERGFELGVEASLPRTRLKNTENTTIEGTLTTASLGDLVVRVMGVGGLDLDATLRAAASRGEVQIISRPVLLAANNERAEINVGSQRPFVQVARVLPTDNTARDEVVQYKDVGTRLRIIPTISTDGYVMLQISQEVNAATAEQQFNAPVISTRSVETRLLVRDGQTIVLGGLIDQQREAAQSGIPVLSSIPIIGGLFGRASRRRSETELFLFLTPRVLRQDTEVDATTGAYQEKAGKVKP